MLGAKGVQVGTRFSVADECTIHENYKQRVLRAEGIDASSPAAASVIPRAD